MVVPAGIFKLCAVARLKPGATTAIVALCSLCLDLMALVSNDTQAGIFDNRISADTTPIEFSVGPVRYRIPRNYLYQMDNWSGGPQEIVSLRVQYPDLLPFSEATERCFRKKVPCRVFELHIEGPIHRSPEAASPEGPPLLAGETKEVGPYGYELRKIGPPDTLSEDYRKILGDRVLFFSCQPFDNRGVPDGVCRSFTRTRWGDEIVYFFSLRYLSEMEQIDTGLRDLVDSFAVGHVNGTTK